MSGVTETLLEEIRKKKLCDYYGDPLNGLSKDEREEITSALDFVPKNDNDNLEIVLKFSNSKLASLVYDKISKDLANIAVRVNISLDFQNEILNEEHNNKISLDYGPISSEKILCGPFVLFTFNRSALSIYLKVAEDITRINLEAEEWISF